MLGCGARDISGRRQPSMARLYRGRCRPVGWHEPQKETRAVASAGLFWLQGRAEPCSAAALAIHPAEGSRAWLGSTRVGADPVGWHEPPKDPRCCQRRSFPGCEVEPSHARLRCSRYIRPKAAEHGSALRASVPTPSAGTNPEKKPALLPARVFSWLQGRAEPCSAAALALHRAEGSRAWLGPTRVVADPSAGTNPKKDPRCCQRGSFPGC